MKNGHWVVAVFSVVALGLTVMLPSSAVAADSASGLWWFDRGKVQEAHDAGFDGTGVKIAVIDSQINPDVPGLRGGNIDVREETYCMDEAGSPIPTVSTDYVAASHGTNIAAIIAGTGETAPGGVPAPGVAPGAEVLYFSAGINAAPDAEGETVSCILETGEAFADSDTGTEEGMSRAISDAVDAGADIISISADGFPFIEDAIAKAQAAGVVIVAAMPNDTPIAAPPGSMNGVVAVQAFDAQGSIATRSDGIPNTSNDVDIAAPGVGLLVQGTADSWDAQTLASGTSLATPIVAGFLAVVKQKYPEATAGQLIQSLIHNTGTKGEHTPEWNNSTGYGAASLTGMLAVDPQKYPDENPLFDADDPDATPNAADVRAAAARLDGASATPDQPESPQAATGVMPWLIVGGIIVILLIIGGTVAIVLTSSSRRRSAERGGNHGP